MLILFGVSSHTIIAGIALVGWLSIGIRASLDNDCDTYTSVTVYKLVVGYYIRLNRHLKI
jgi:hypothetical protein